MAKKLKKKRGSEREAPTPLTEKQVRRIKRRAAKASTKGLTVGVDLMVAAPGVLKIDKRVLTKEKNTVFRPSAPLAKKSGKARGVRIQLKIRGAELGTHVFPPSIDGVQPKVQRLTAADKRLARAGLPDLDGFLPDHLPFNPIPPEIDAKLRVKKFQIAKKTEEAQATTVFSPDDRYTFSDTSYPWSTIGRVDTAGGVASGVMVGPRHMLTVSHAMVWLAGNSSGWVRFRPSYFDGSTPFGEAWATRWYAYRKAVGPGLSRAEIREDYCVLVLDRRIGDTTGWMGSRTYSDSWDGGSFWRHIGYPGDLAALQRPSYERDIALDGSGADSNSHKRAFHQGDVWPGQSGGPFFAWWTGENFPRTVAVQSAHNSSTNFAAAGSRLVNLIIQARNEHP